jgi:hypothetical protein
MSAALEEQWDAGHRRSLEAIAVEAYRTGALTESQVRRLLGLDSRFQVHALLKEHHVPLQWVTPLWDASIATSAAGFQFKVSGPDGETRCSRPFTVHRPGPPQEIPALASGSCS